VSLPTSRIIPALALRQSHRRLSSCGQDHLDILAIRSGGSRVARDSRLRNGSTLLEANAAPARDSALVVTTKTQMIAE